MAGYRKPAMQIYTPEVEKIATPIAPAELSEASSSVSRSPAQIFKRPAFIFLVLLLVSLPIRFVHLQAPIWGEHEFRQSQTAMSVWDIREHGISWLHPRLPLFGPPWECPLEYPVFQLVAAGIDSIAPWHNLDASIRLTGLIFFYLASVALYLLARQLFDRPAVALFTSAIFLFAPYNFNWSQALTIEYAAGFFALAYLLCLIRWTLKPGWVLFFLTLLFGTLGSLTKISTFAMPLLVAGTLAALHTWEAIQAKRSFNADVDWSPYISGTTLRPMQFVQLGCLLALPVAIGYFYLHFTDEIKAQSPYTAWLCSNNPYIRKWDYGTLHQRLSGLTWGLVLDRIGGVVQSTPDIILLIGLLALPFKTRIFEGLRHGKFWLGLSLAGAPFAVVLAFFNLYVVHSYYYIAVAPLLALAAGVGTDFVIELIRRPYLKLLVLLGFSGLWLHSLSGQWGEFLAPFAPNRRVIYLTQAGNIIPKDDPVIVVTLSEWNPYVPYYLKHRAFMALLINKPVDTKPLTQTDYFKQNGFHWLLVDGEYPAVKRLAAGVASRWKFARLVPGPNNAYKLYCLSDQEIGDAINPASWTNVPVSAFNNRQPGATSQPQQ